MTGSPFDHVDGRVLALLTEGEIAPGSLAAWAADWEDLVAQAEAQRVAQLLYERLRSADRLGELPAPAAERLARGHYRMAYRNVQILHTLERLLIALAGCTSRVVLLKGAGLLAGVYENPAVRPLDDLDILVLPQELETALRCVEAMGYQRERGELFTGAPLNVTPHAEMFRRGAFPERIELHHHWLGVRAELGRHVSMADVCGRAVPVAIGAAEAWLPEPHDQVLHLAGHLALHLTGGTALSIPARLVWYCDLDRTIRRAGAGLDWDVVLGRAEQYRMSHPLQLVLPDLQRGFGTPIPQEALAALARLEAAGPYRHHAPVWSAPPSRLADGIHRLSDTEGFRQRVKFAWQLAFPSWSYMRSNYGGGSWPQVLAHYAKRWSGALQEAIAASRQRS